METQLPQGAPLPCSRACRQTIICCCQIFVFLDLYFQSLHTITLPPNPTDHSRSPLLQDTCLSPTRPSAEWHFPAISACLERLCKRSEAHLGKHFQQFHNNKESPAQRSAGTSHNHRPIDQNNLHTQHHKHDCLKSMPFPTAYHVGNLLPCLSANQPVPAFLIAVFNRKCLAQLHNTDSPSAPPRPVCPLVNPTVAHIPLRSVPAESAGERARPSRLETLPR